MAVFNLFNAGDLDALRGKIKSKEKRVIVALSAALNKAGRETVTLSSAEWNAFATTDKSYIKGYLDIVSGATPNRLQTKVWARSRATRANNFRHTEYRRSGVFLNVKRGASGGLLENAFVVKARSDGKPLIIQRLKKYEKGDGRRFKKGTFKAVYGPSINQHFTDSRERVAPQAMSAAKDQFLKAMRE
jgi:hypothetical protein